MPTLIWKGDAAPIAQVTKLTVAVGGGLNASDTFSIQIGSKKVTVSPNAAAIIADATAIATAYNALSATLYPEFKEAQAVDNGDGSLTLTAVTPGVPFTCTLTNTGTGTFTQATPTAATGGAFADNTQNWTLVGGASRLPTAGDDVFYQNTSNPCLYALTALSGVGTLLSFNVDQSFSGTIGLPNNNANGGYTEYRQRYLQINATTVNIGKGDGAGSGRMKLDLGSVQATINVQNTGQPAETGVKSLILLGTHASNALRVDKGSVGVALFAGELSTLLTLLIAYRTAKANDADVKLGIGVTITSATITKTGGNLEINSSVPTVNHRDGEMVVGGAAAITTLLEITGGAVHYKSSGTITLATVTSGGILDFNQDATARTVTNLTVNAKGTVLDKQKSCTFTNPVKFTSSDYVFDWGDTYNLQRS